MCHCYIKTLKQHRTNIQIHRDQLTEKVLAFFRLQLTDSNGHISWSLKTISN